MQAVRYIVILLLFLSAFRNTNAQGLVIRNYNVKDGLANATVYSAIQDEEGFIWFATPTGASKFDGKRFRNYTKKDGLSDNDVIKLVSDSRGRVWFFTYNGKPSFYRNQVVHNEDNDSSLQFNSRSHYMQYAFEDKARTIIWFLNSGGRIIQYNGRKLTYDKLGAKQTDLFWLLNNDSIFRTLQPYFNLPEVRDTINANQRIFLSSPYPASDPDFGDRIRNNPVIITGNTLYSYTRKDVIPFMKGDEWGIHEDISTFAADQDHLWIGTQRALYLIRNFFKGERKVSKLLANHYITGILNDRDGNIWITTYGDGVYHIPFKHFYFGYLDNTNGLYSHSVYSVFKDRRNGLLYIGENAGILNIMDKGVIRRFSLDSTAGRNSVLGILPLPKGEEVLIGTDNNIFQYAPSYQRPRLLINQRGIKDMDITPSGRFRAVTRNRLLNGPDGKSQDLGSLETMISSIVCLNDSAYYLGTTAGLFYCSGGDRMPEPVQHDPRLSQSIKDLQWINGYLWVGTSDQGIFVVKDNAVVRHFRTDDNLVSDICQQLYYDGKEHLYVATNRGVSVIDTKALRLVRSFTSNDGLMSDDIRGLSHYGDTLYIATSNGLCYFSEHHIPTDTVPPTVYLNSIRYGDSTYTAGLHFSHIYRRGASFQAEFGAIAYDLPDLVEYQYNFSNDTIAGWVSTMSNIVPYPRLQPGEYTLLIRARKYKSDWSKPMAVHISILPQWYQEWWARGIVVLLALLAVLLVLRYIIGRIRGGERRKTEYNRRIAELEAKALTNQMNPHFIFNSLNSVQHLILEKEEKQALNFLADFATLMRQMLNNSRKSYISLEDEIAFLTRYLELEKIRFANSFVYRFELSEELKEYTLYIPPMIIQPILENAVKHGLAPKNGSGHLVVRLELNGDLLYCAVDDDGIGWEHANNIKSGKLAKHESTALSVIKERLQIIKSFNGSVGKLEIIDKFKSGFGNKEGTLVEILIPIVKML
ncbi:sensor histidine kinase [Chitinophaga lutea]